MGSSTTVERYTSEPNDRVQVLSWVSALVFSSDAIVIVIRCLYHGNAVIILGLSVPVNACRFTATFSTTDVAGFPLP